MVAVDAKGEALWRTTAESAYDRIRGKIVPAEAFDEAKRHVADFRKMKQAASPR